VIAKEAIFNVQVEPSLGAPGTEPTPAEQAVLERMAELAAQTQKDSLDAAGSAEAAGQSAGKAAISVRLAANSALAAEEAAEQSGDSQRNAAASALKAEGYAIGEQDGAEVAPGSPYYQNNAKFFAELAKQGAAESGFAWFDINEADGQMYVTITPNLAEDVSFQINENTGILEVLVYA